MRILVTAGPTREYFDDVRFISNASSGRLGYAIAAEAARRGHHVVLVSGPVRLPAPPDVEFVSVVTGREMLDICRERFPDCDAAVMCAAVCDYRPTARSAGKAPKSTQAHAVELEPTEDICVSLGQMKERTDPEPSRDEKPSCNHSPDRGRDRKGAEPKPSCDRNGVPPPRHRILIGFALETDDVHARAEAKLHRKRCDAIVLNHPAGIGRDRTTVEVFTPPSGWSAPRSASKTDIAAYLVDLLDDLAAG